MFPVSNSGRALADVLFGDYNPSGRLPITYPKYNQHLTTYDFKWPEINSGNYVDVEFEFGHGLSYTTFDYTNLNVPSILYWDDQLKISLEVRNSGSRQGDHTVLLYVSDDYRSVTPPNKELKSYTKLSLSPNEQTQVQFTLDRTDLSFIGIDLIRRTESGVFTIRVGGLEAKFTLLADNTSVTTTLNTSVTTTLNTSVTTTLNTSVTTTLNTSVTTTLNTSVTTTLKSKSNYHECSIFYATILLFLSMTSI